MRKVCLVLVLLILPTSLFAQYRRRPYDRYYDNRFELTPFVGYTWGGTIYSDVTTVFGPQDVQAASSANVGVNFGIPIANSGMKLTLLANHQATNLTTGGGGLFEPDNRVANMGVTYYHAGLEMPFNASRNATPYVAISAGVTNLAPDISGVASSNKFSASAGLGVKIPINYQFGVKVEGRGYFTSLGTGSDNNCFRCFDNSSRAFTQGQVNLGFIFSF